MLRGQRGAAGATELCSSSILALAVRADHDASPSNDAVALQARRDLRGFSNWPDVGGTGSMNKVYYLWHSRNLSGNVSQD